MNLIQKVLCVMLLIGSTKGFSQPLSVADPLPYRITLRPVLGAGGEHAVGPGLVAEYGYQLLRRNSTVEVQLQLGSFGDRILQPQSGRRNYEFRSVFAGVGVQAGTGTRGRLFANAGIGVAYFHGRESYEYQQQTNDIPPRQVWLDGTERYRTAVFNVNAAVGVRISPRWEIDLKGSLFTDRDNINALLLIGPGLSRRF